jgi:hypothetical protein
MRKAVLLALPVSTVILGFLLAGCGQSGGGAIKTAMASLSASGRPSAPNATTASTAPPPSATPAPPSPTPAPPSPTKVALPSPRATAPSAGLTVTNAPPAAASTGPVTAAGTEPSSPLLWVWLALGALVFIGIIWWIAHASGRRRAAKVSWRSQVIDAYAEGAALQDAMSTVAGPGALGRQDASARWADIQRRADDLNQKLYAMRAAAPDEQAHAAVVDVITSLGAVRSAMDAQRVPGGAAGAQTEVTRQRLLAFEISLQALRSPGSRP